MPFPGEIFISSSTLPKKKYQGVCMVGASPCFWIVNSAPSGPVVISPAVIFQSSKAESPLVKSEVKEERANPSLGGHVSGFR